MTAKGFWVTGSDERRPDFDAAVETPPGEGSAPGTGRGSSEIPAIPAAAAAEATPERRGGDQPPELPDFRLLAKIGQGGFGSVWIAQHRHTGDAVAIKFIAPGSREIELKGLQHLRQRVREGQEHLVWPEYIGEANEFIYCVMDLADPVVDGPLFADRYEALTLLKYAKQKGRLDLLEAAGVTLAIAKGLAFLQAAGLRHGDIKPANILRARGKWKLIDYGMMGGLDVKARGGTRSYLPPEGPHGDRADQFALGIVLHELVFGHRPNANAREAWPESRLASGLRRIQQRLSEPDPDRRFASSAELVQELESLLSTSKPAATGAAGACPSCGEPIYGSEEACGSCGSELWRQCPVCQHRGSIVQRYCTQCRGPVHGIFAMRKELNEADALLCDGVHRDSLQRIDGPLRDLLQEVSRDLAKLQGGDLSRRRRVEAIEAEFEGRMTRMADRCRLLQQIDGMIADAHERADVTALRESIARAIEIVPGASTYERLRADLPLLEARSRWTALLGRLGNPQVDPSKLSSERLRMVIATLRGSLPEQAVARDEAKVVLATLQDEQRTRIRKRCGAAAAWHLREGRSLQALRWLRIAESKHAADREMLDSIARLSAELKPLCKDLRDAGRNVLQRTGGHREMRRIAESLSVVEGADSRIASQLRAEWPRRRRLHLLGRIATRSLASVSRGDFVAADAMLAMAHRIADREPAARDRVIDLDNSITARIRTVRELLGSAIAAEASAQPEAALRFLEQASQIAPDWNEVSERLDRVREVAAVVPVRKRRRRLLFVAAMSVLLLGAAAVSYHVVSLAPLREVAAALTESTGGRAVEARQEAIGLLTDPRRREAMLLTDLGLADEVRRQWELSWERTYGKEGPLAPEVAFAAADELAAWRGDGAAAAADPWTDAATRRLASGVLATRTSRRIDRVTICRDGILATARSGGDILVAVGLVEPEIESLLGDAVPPEGIEVWLPPLAELVAALDPHPGGHDLRASVLEKIERWCIQSTEALHASIEQSVLEASRVGPSRVGSSPEQSPPELPSCGDERVLWVDASRRLREELGWKAVRIDLAGALPPVGAGDLEDPARDGSALLLVPVVVANPGGSRLLLVSTEPLSELAWRAVAGDPIESAASNPRADLSIRAARDFCSRVPEFAYLGRRWRAILPDEGGWRAAWELRSDPLLLFDPELDEWLDLAASTPRIAAARVRDGLPRPASAEGDSLTVLRPFFEAVEMPDQTIDPMWIELASRSSTFSLDSGDQSP